jgi:hypothetical protein
VSGRGGRLAVTVVGVMPIVWAEGGVSGGEGR